MPSETRRVRFTKKAIEQLPSPESDRSIWYDTETKGLTVAVWSSGRRTFYLYRKVAGRPERIRLGEWPTMTVEQARKAAAIHVGKIESGENPAAKRRQQSGAPPLNDVFEAFAIAPARTRAKRHRSQITTDGYRYLFNQHLAHWKDRPISRIERRDVEALHNKLGAERPYLANRVLSLTKAIFGFAVDEKMIDSNPVSGIRAFEETDRERVLRADELPRFFAAVNAEPSEKIRDFVFLALYTGQRKSNVLGMRWSELNLATKTWTIPRTKNGKPLTVPLADQAVEILTRREASKGSSEFVFPGRHGSDHLVDPMRQWREILARAGLTNLRIHDLRRTFGSWQADTGSSLPIIGKSLGHARPETTQIYARLDMRPVRNAVDVAVSAMVSAATGNENGEGDNNGNKS